jgi:hypothetical protein
MYQNGGEHGVALARNTLKGHLEQTAVRVRKTAHGDRKPSDANWAYCIGLGRRKSEHFKQETASRLARGGHRDTPVAA